MNTQVSFDFYGVRVLVVTKSGGVASDVIDYLGKDFDFFKSDSSQFSPHILIELKAESPPKHYCPEGSPLFRTKACEVFGLGALRICVYSNSIASVVCETEFKFRKFQIFAHSADHLHELAYLAMSSAVGEELDLKGFHRVHALGVFANEKAGLVVLPHGGGKSAIATLLLKENRPDKYFIFSDESPLMRGGWVYPFPIRIALKKEVAQALGVLNAADERVFSRMLYPPKNLFSIPKESVPAPAPIRWVCIGSESNLKEVTSLTRWRAFSSLLQSMVVGIGVAQMVEFMFRPIHVYRLVFIGFSRLFSAVALCFNPKVRFYALKITRDAFVNAQNLRVFIENQK